MPRLNRLDPVWFRLKAPMPIEVVFPSATFRCYYYQDRNGGWWWQLRAIHVDAGGEVLISEQFKSESSLAHALYQNGFAARHLTVGETILLRLVREGRAEQIDAPIERPTPQDGWPWMWP